MRNITFLLSFTIMLTTSLSSLSSNEANNVTKIIVDATTTSTNLPKGNNPKTTRKSITLYEDSINGIRLPFKRIDMTKELKLAFTGFEVIKETGQQDGPDFQLYIIKKNGEDLTYISMNDEDPLKVDNIIIKDVLAKDVYGVKIGDTFEQIKNKRKGKIQSSTESYEMRNTYVYFDNSNIMYKMTGETEIPDDNPNFKLSDEQIKNWKVSDIIWRKNKSEESILDYYLPEAIYNKANFHSQNTDMTRVIYYIDNGNETYDVMDAHLFQGNSTSIITRTIKFTDKGIVMIKSVSTTVVETNKKQTYNPAQVLLKMPTDGQIETWSAPGENGDKPTKYTSSWTTVTFEGQNKKAIKLVSQYTGMKSKTVSYYVQGVGLTKTDFIDENGVTKPFEKFAGLSYEKTTR